MANINDISSIKFGLLDDEGNVIKESYAPFEIDLDTTDETVEDITKEESPEVGDLIEFNRDGYDVTEGKIYEIEGVTDLGDILFTDDIGDDHYWGYPSDAYTLIKRKTERELLANLSQEVADLKKQLAELKSEVATAKMECDLHKELTKAAVNDWGTYL